MDTLNSLIGKVCTLQNSFYFGTNTLNLSGEFPGGQTFNKIYVETNEFDDEFLDLYFGNEVVGTCYYGDGYFYLNGMHYQFTITGGEDADNPDVINLMYSMCIYIKYPPNNSKESLDNKVIEFNKILTKFPPLTSTVGYINGEFKIQCITDEGDEYYRFADTIVFPEIGAYGGQLFFIGESCNVYYGWSNGYWYDDGSYMETAPVFEKFKYTGLENNEEFMNWLSKNATVGLPKNKDKKVKTPTTLSGSTICMTSFSKSCYYTVGYYSCDGFIDGKYQLFSISCRGDGNLELEIIRKVVLDDDDNMVNIDGTPAVGVSAPGEYCGIFTCSDYGITYVQDNGYQATFELPLIIENFDGWSLNTDPEFLEYVASNSDVTSIEGAIIKFKPTLSDWALPLPEGYSGIKYTIKALVSYKLNGERRTYISDVIMVEYNECPPRIFFVIYHQNYIFYDVEAAKWQYTGDEGTVEDVTISYFSSSELNENPDFINWVYENAEDVCFAKGINSTEELITNVCDAIKLQKGDGTKIKAQNIVSEIVNLSPREVVEDWDGTVVIE